MTTRYRYKVMTKAMKADLLETTQNKAEDLTNTVLDAVLDMEEKAKLIDEIIRNVRQINDSDLAEGSQQTFTKTELDKLEKLRSSLDKFITSVQDQFVAPLVDMFEL